MQFAARRHDGEKGRTCKYRKKLKRDLKQKTMLYVFLFFCSLTN